MIKSHVLYQLSYGLGGFRKSARTIVARRRGSKRMKCGGEWCEFLTDALRRRPDRPVYVGVEMAKPIAAALTCASLGGLLTGCATSSGKHADNMASKSYEVAGEAGGQFSSGFTRAAATPLRDFNLIREKIPPVLLRAEDRPYDSSGLDTCDELMNEVSALDMALGPDVDVPKIEMDRMHRGASFAAQAALDGVKDLAEGFIPMRSWVKRLSGATQAEAEVRRAILAGSVRRGFIKALGMTRNCGWPAAPMGFEPTQVAANTPPPPPVASPAPVVVAAAAPAASPAAPIAQPTQVAVHSVETAPSAHAAPAPPAPTPVSLTTTAPSRPTGR